MISNHAKPPIKFAGGKTQLLPKLLPLIPELRADGSPSIRTYYEPFVGGGALFWELGRLGRYQRAVINDSNAELVNLYVVLAHHPDELMERLTALGMEYSEGDSKAVYYRWREQDPTKMESSVERAARFIALNKTSYNGLWRVNKAGRFNVPWNQTTSVTLFDPDVITGCSKVMEGNVGISFGDFTSLFPTTSTPIYRGDVVYFDPPYLPKSFTANFTSYAKEGFRLVDHRRLASLMERLRQAGALCILSNADVPAARELFTNKDGHPYPGYEIISTSGRRSVNSAADKRGKVGEIIVVGRPS